MNYSNSSSFGRNSFKLHDFGRQPQFSGNNVNQNQQYSQLNMSQAYAYPQQSGGYQPQLSDVIKSHLDMYRQNAAQNQYNFSMQQQLMNQPQGVYNNQANIQQGYLPYGQYPPNNYMMQNAQPKSGNTLDDYINKRAGNNGSSKNFSLEGMGSGTSSRLGAGGNFALNRSTPGLGAQNNFSLGTGMSSMSGAGAGNFSLPQTNNNQQLAFSGNVTQNGVQYINPQQQVQYPQKVDASNDGKFSLLEFGKNFVAGVGEFGTNLVKNIIKHPLKSAAIIGLTLAVGATTPGLLLLTGASVVLSGFALAGSAAKMGMNIKDGNWDALEKDGKHLGHNTASFALSRMAAIKAGKTLATKANGAKAADKLSNADAIKKASRFGQFGFQYLRSGLGAVNRTIKSGFKSGDFNIVKHFKTEFNLNYSKGHALPRTKMGTGVKTAFKTVVDSTKDLVKTGKMDLPKTYQNAKSYVANTKDQRGLFRVLENEMKNGSSTFTPEELSWLKNNSKLWSKDLSGWKELLPITATKVESGELMIVQ